jgi:hypothetical protein
VQPCTFIEIAKCSAGLNRKIEIIIAFLAGYELAPQDNVHGVAARPDARKTLEAARHSFHRAGVQYIAAKHTSATNNGLVT